MAQQQQHRRDRLRQCDASRPGRFERTDRYGSTCYVWFGTGVVDARLAAGVGDEMWAMGLLKSSGTKYAFVLTPGAVATRSRPRSRCTSAPRRAPRCRSRSCRRERRENSHAMASVTYLGEHPHDRGGAGAALGGLFDGSPKSEASACSFW